MNGKQMFVALLSAVFPLMALSQVGGSGTVNKIPKFTPNSATLGDSAVYESNGNVGIGTTSPVATLDVNGNAVIRSYGTTLTTTGNGGPVIIFSNAATPTTGNWTLGVPGWANATQFFLYDRNNSTTPFLVEQGAGNNDVYIRAGGNVGIGTNTPDGKLNVTGAPNNWTSNGWEKGLRLDGINAIELGGGATTKYGIGQSDNNLFFFDTSADDNSSGANYRMVISGGNVGIGTVSPQSLLSVAGTIQTTTGGVKFPDNSVQTTAWTGVLCAGDYAESVDVSGDRHRYGPGDVLQIDDDNPSRFVKVAEPYSPAVAGVFSTKPGALGRRQTTPKSPDEVPLAMIGIVPVKVTAENGPIRPHDLLVSSSVPGYAMKGTDRSKLVGAVIGKAMGSLDKGTGTIEVLVTLQ